MRDYIEQARMSQDSAGGIVECCAVGVPAGLGSPMFGGVENVISSIVFGIPAVKGLEFGTGFGFASLHGSEANDPYAYQDGKVVTLKTITAEFWAALQTGCRFYFVPVSSLPPLFRRSRKRLT